jgi:hypothetical protein
MRIQNDAIDAVKLAARQLGEATAAQLEYEHGIPEMQPKHIPGVTMELPCFLGAYRQAVKNTINARAAYEIALAVLHSTVEMAA